MDHDHGHHMGGGMDHSMPGHGDMGGGGGGMKCSMNMLFTWDTTNLCIVFRQWHVTSTFTLVLSLLGVVVIVAGYEMLREGIRQYEASVNKRADTTPPPLNTGEDHDHDQEEEETVTETTPFFLGSSNLGQNRAEVTRRAHAIKAVLYGIQNFYAFMIMLIFMTYNGWVMIAVSVGAALGYFIFGGRTPVTKDTACH
ncbi:Ctr copper transporter family-domain-containing protein [Diplogelasinospora grovesii]|uniref:Copper transport protein n=1 Tax=Diplogelasinospora grovesii TaxID=303347 RepID=A0AAN6S711_9PEZI|nr:Ctr copper transporter family-domain-containing protein [Diplogelasinospora grovesii]